MGFGNLPVIPNMSDEFEFRSGRRNMYFEKFDVELADQPRGGGVVETSTLLVCNIKLGLISQQLLHSLGDVGRLGNHLFG